MAIASFGFDSEFGFRASDFSRDLAVITRQSPTIMASIGVEPICPFGQWILSPSRLPIPPRGRYEYFPRKNRDLLRYFRVVHAIVLYRFSFRQIAPRCAELRGLVTSWVTRIFRRHSFPAARLLMNACRRAWKPARVVPGRHMAITAMLDNSKGNPRRLGRPIASISALSRTDGYSEIAV